MGGTMSMAKDYRDWYLTQGGWKPGDGRELTGGVTSYPPPENYVAKARYIYKHSGFSITEYTTTWDCAAAIAA
jgi:hypothetical protein